MNTFKELLSNPSKMEPGLLQRQARTRFSSVVASSHLLQRLPDDPIPSHGGSRFAIIGVASYSPEELGLLDQIENSHSIWQNQWKIAVFDVAEWTGAADAARYVPQVAPVAQSPVVALWTDGQLTDTKTGLQPGARNAQAIWAYSVRIA